MRSFTDFITEQAVKNLHLEHIEDEVFNNGIIGARESITFLKSLRDMLSGSANAGVDVTVKFDGAPAIFVGTDPSDGEFFVGTKGVFNKNPKLIKEPTDIARFGYAGQLAEKLLISFIELKKLGIKNVLQGDMMYTNGDLESIEVDGEQYISFQPNTIVYAVPKRSAFAQKILKSKMGIVFHTTYNGTSLEEMGAEFGADISGLNKVDTVWFSNAEYNDKSGTVTFTKQETSVITGFLSSAGKAFRKVKSAQLKDFLEFQNSLPSGVTGIKIKTYLNSLIRQGTAISGVKNHVTNYVKYVTDYAEVKTIGKVKTEKAKEAKKEQRDEIIENINRNKTTIQAVMELYTFVTYAKEAILEKLDSGTRLFSDTFIKTDNGYKVVNDEGYVAIDTIKGNAVKLVDRLEFSYNNFNGIKNWDK
tara:strand:- start:1132 stop:2385 length:1254 start_codon:yes stop_codon:yes gene_type:complete